MSNRPVLSEPDKAGRPSANSLSLQQAYTEWTVAVLRDDDRVAGAWMKGSLATGAAGLYSDVDLGVVVYDGYYDEFRADREKLLRSIGQLVGMGEASVGQRVTVALFADPIELDLTIDPLSASEIYGPEIGWILFDRSGGKLAAAQAKACTTQGGDPFRAREIVAAFWLRVPRMRRWVAQEDLHRAGKELQVARNWLVELMLIANKPDKSHAVQRDTSVILSPRQRDQLGAVYVLAGFAPRSLACCMIRLAYAISIWGRVACARQGSEYPEELERVSMTAVSHFYENVFGPLSGCDNGYSER